MADTSNQSPNKTYGADNITALEGLEADKDLYEVVQLKRLLQVSWSPGRNLLTRLCNAKQFLLALLIAFEVFGHDSCKAGIAIGKPNRSFQDDLHSVPVLDLLVQG